MKTPAQAWTFASAVGIFVASIVAVLQGHTVLQAATMFIVVMAMAAVFHHDRMASRRRRLLATTVAQHIAAERDTRIQEALNTVGDGYCELTTDGTVLTWNEKSTALFGWSSDEMIGASFIDMVRPVEDRERAKATLAQFWTTSRHTGSRVEYEARHSNGATLFIEMTAWKIDDYGVPRMAVFMRDMTKYREAEQHVQRALDDERAAVLRLQELDRVQSDFVSSISHELRTPLTSTLGYLELLGEGDAGDMTEEQNRMIEVAARNAKRLQRLIEDVLMLSRIESGDFRVRFQPVQVHELVQKAIHRSKLSAAERNIEITTDVSPHLATCLGDSVQLVKAIDNIVGNAVKFTPPSGSVKVSVERFAEHVTIRVTDNGIGIADEERPHLFQRFFRAADVVQQAYHGTGLGLTITKSIIEHHGGSIQVKSRLSEGTTVSITLPSLPVNSEETVVLA